MGKRVPVPHRLQSPKNCPGPPLVRITPELSWSPVGQNHPTMVPVPPAPLSVRITNPQYGPSSPISQNYQPPIWSRSPVGRNHPIMVPVHRQSKSPHNGAGPPSVEITPEWCRSIVSQKSESPQNGQCSKARQSSHQIDRIYLRKICNFFPIFFFY